MTAVKDQPAATATHLALSALYSFEKRQGRFPASGSSEDLGLLTAWAREKLTRAGCDAQTFVTIEADEGEEDDVKVEPSFWTRVEHALGEV